MTRPGALRITAPYNDGLREVEAYPTPVPGLLISPDAKVEGAWCVCHAASGLALADCPDPESALNIAVKLGELADWTKSTRGLRRDRHLRRAWQQLILENGLAERIIRHAALSNADMRQMEADAGGAA